MAKKEVKTNAMRILDRMKIPYTHQAYECDEFVDGIQTADKLKLPHEKVYKTLLCICSADRSRAGSQKGSKSSRCKVCFHASCEGYHAGNGICARRLHSDRYEEAVQNIYQ